MNKNDITNYGEIIFEIIKHFDEYGNEYWYARELMPLLDYNKWQNFHNVINMAKKACKLSNHNVSNQFTEVSKLIIGGNGNRQNVIDYRLTRYACYLVAQNGDSRKPAVALAQTYFAIQTRKQELLEKEYNELTEDEKRVYQRDLTRKGNYSLNQTALRAGVRNIDKFHNAGYKGLYGRETANDIAKRKGLRYREDILDNMGSSELIANLFRIDQTNQKLRSDNIKGENNANSTHNKIGKIIILYLNVAKSYERKSSKY